MKMGASTEAKWTRRAMLDTDPCRILFVHHVLVAWRAEGMTHDVLCRGLCGRAIRGLCARVPHRRTDAGLTAGGSKRLTRHELTIGDPISLSETPVVA